MRLLPGPDSRGGRRRRSARASAKAATSSRTYERRAGRARRSAAPRDAVQSFLWPRRSRAPSPRRRASPGSQTRTGCAKPSGPSPMGSFRHGRWTPRSRRASSTRRTNAFRSRISSSASGSCATWRRPSAADARVARRERRVRTSRGLSRRAPRPRGGRRRLSRLPALGDAAPQRLTAPARTMLAAAPRVRGPRRRRTGAAARRHVSRRDVGAHVASGGLRHCGRRGPGGDSSRRRVPGEPRAAPERAVRGRPARTRRRICTPASPVSARTLGRRLVDRFGFA